MPDAVYTDTEAGSLYSTYFSLKKSMLSHNPAFIMHNSSSANLHICTNFHFWMELHFAL